MSDSWLSPAGASELYRAQQQIEQRRSTGPHPLPGGIHVCPTCGGARCERCGMTGRGSYARVYADNQGDGRATLQLWFGAAATMELVATSDHSLSHDRVDSILATLAEAPGIVIRDRRGR